MNEMVERMALRLFWRAEHLDPSEDGDVPEGEYGKGWPASLSERKREFWRLLAIDAIGEMREPTEAMLNAAEALDDPYTGPSSGGPASHSEAWRAMIDAAFGEH